MRDPARIDKVIRRLRKLWKSQPDLRLNQVLGLIASEYGYTDMFYVEDEELARMLKNSKYMREDN